MIIEFDTLSLRNFLSLESAFVDFNNRGFVLVEGVNSNPVDNAKSNGAGKSALFEGLFWILTGDTVRGTKDVVRRGASDGACGELTFKIDKNTYKVTRFKEDSIYGNNLKVIYNGEDVSGKGIRDSSKVLEQYLPELNAQLLGGVIVLGQGLPQRFTNNTPAGRKDILEKLSKSDYMIEDIKNKLSLRRIELNTDIRKVKDQLIAVESATNTSATLIANRKSMLAALPAEELFKDKIAELSVKIQVEERNIADTEAEVTKLNTEYANLSTELSDTLLAINETYNSSARPINEEILKHSEELAKARYIISDANKNIKAADNVVTVCPTCHRPLDGVHKIDTAPWKEAIEVQTEVMNNLTSEIQKLREALSALEQQRDNDDRITDIKQRSSLTEHTLTTKRSELRTLNTVLKTLQSELDEATTELQSYKTRKDMWEKDITDAEVLIAANNDKVKVLSADEEKLELHLEIINKLINVASKDFRTYLLDGVIEFINSRVKYYGKRLFGNDSVEFRNDGNQIWIGYSQKQYENLSGGEKQKCDLVVQFALRDMLMQILMFSCNILVLDEVFDNLDEVGCNNLIDLITEELRDVESLFIITHHADVEIPYDNKITVHKSIEGVSSIE